MVDGLSWFLPTATMLQNLQPTLVFQQGWLDVLKPNHFHYQKIQVLTPVCLPCQYIQFNKIRQRAIKISTAFKGLLWSTAHYHTEQWPFLHFISVLLYPILVIMNLITKINP